MAVSSADIGGQMNTGRQTKTPRELDLARRVSRTSKHPTEDAQAPTLGGHTAVAPSTGFGRRFAEKQRTEPACPVPDHRRERDVRIGPIQRSETAELVDVFCLLLDKRVDHVIDGNRADDPLLVVDP